MTVIQLSSSLAHMGCSSKEESLEQEVESLHGINRVNPCCFRKHDTNVVATFTQWQVLVLLGAPSTDTQYKTHEMLVGEDGKIMKR